MNITITPTEHIWLRAATGPVRLWRGATDAGTPVLVAVAMVCTNEANFDQLQRELTEAGIRHLENPGLMLPNCPIPLLAPVPATATPTQPQPEKTAADVPL